MATNTASIPTTDRSIRNLVRSFLTAKAHADAATKEAEGIKSRLKQALKQSGQKTVVVEGVGSVLFVTSTNITVNVERLRDLVDDTTFALVTNTVVDIAAWKVAVEKGLITTDVVSQVQSTSDVDSLRSTFIGA